MRQDYSAVDRIYTLSELDKKFLHFSQEARNALVEMLENPGERASILAKYQFREPVVEIIKAGNYIRDSYKRKSRRYGFITVPRRSSTPKHIELEREPL